MSKSFYWFCKDLFSLAKVLINDCFKVSFRDFSYVSVLLKLPLAKFIDSSYSWDMILAVSFPSYFANRFFLSLGSLFPIFVSLNSMSTSIRSKSDEDEKLLSFLISMLALSLSYFFAWWSLSLLWSDLTSESLSLPLNLTRFSPSSILVFFFLILVSYFSIYFDSLCLT